MTTVLYSVAVLGVLGVLLGGALGLAAKLFAVEEDPRIAAILEALPGANCGGCGFPGCAGYAAALVAGNAPSGQCTPGGAAASVRIAAILKGETPPAEAPPPAAAPPKRKRAIIRRPGDCTGCGQCVEACPPKIAALSLCDGVATVETAKCVGCGRCAKVCPHGVIDVE